MKTLTFNNSIVIVFAGPSLNRDEFHAHPEPHCRTFLSCLFSVASIELFLCIHAYPYSTKQRPYMIHVPVSQIIQYSCVTIRQLPLNSRYILFASFSGNLEKKKRMENVNLVTKL